MIVKSHLMVIEALIDLIINKKMQNNYKEMQNHRNDPLNDY